MFHDSRKYLLRIDLFILEMIPSQGPLVNLLPALTFEASLSSSWKPLWRWSQHISLFIIIRDAASHFHFHPTNNFTFIQLIVVWKWKWSKLVNNLAIIWCYFSSMDNSSYGVNPWVCCASGNVSVIYTHSSILSGERHILSSGIGIGRELNWRNFGLSSQVVVFCSDKGSCLFQSHQKSHHPHYKWYLYHHRRSGYTVCHSGRSSVRLCFAPNPPLLNPAACQLPTLSTLFYSKLIQHFQLSLFYFYIESFTFWRNNSFPDQIKIVISPSKKKHF